ncbi:MAG: agmatinase [Acidobacteria bacterium]|jgi:agmatinase|nr:agmatinase [Acidobacteriota bacterium]
MKTAARLVPFGGPEVAVDLNAAAVAVLPVPYDLTSTWKKGADQGPAALLEASANMELYDIPTATEPWRIGIATLPPLVCSQGPEVLAELVEERVGEQLADGRLPVVLGGEHSVSIGAIRAAVRAVPGTSVLQIDAHADTRESYEGSACNHACVMARAREVAPIVQVGIRSIDVSERAALDESRVLWAHDIVRCGPRERSWIDRALALLGEDVYVTIDLDGFDPSLVPATGTPEPGGLLWHHVEDLLTEVARQRRVVGFDVVELLPTPGQWASEFLAAKLVYRFLAEIVAGGGGAP